MNRYKKIRRQLISRLINGMGILILSDIFLLKRVKSKSKPKILIVGMGIGGASCLKYLNKISDMVEIIVIEKFKNIRTGPFSNLVIGNIIDENNITFEINRRKYPNVKFIFDEIKLIDAEVKFVKISNNIRINYDFLILSPGIGYKDHLIEGFDLFNNDITPHCWDGGSDIQNFKRKLDDLETNSTILLSSPDYPYRCPPAPYERASLIANYKKKIGKKVKIIIFDSKDSFTKKENFFKEWDLNYKDIIEWIPRSKGGRIVFYDHKNNTIINDQGEKFKGDFIHIIPDQRAANIIYESNLLNLKKDWCKINPVSFELDRFKDIYVVGDSIDAGDMPKSAFSANSQAKVLATNLLNKILELDYVDPVFLNTCYSFSKKDRAFSISAWYRLNSTKDRIISLGSSESIINSNVNERKKEAMHAFGWYETMVNDLFI